jgi:hypothetical protein
MVRALNQDLIDVEEIPNKKIYHKIVYNKDEGKSVNQIREMFDVKSKLARKGVKSNLKELELGIVNSVSSSTHTPNLLPRGGETLITNPLISISEKSKKHKKSKKLK